MEKRRYWVALLFVLLLFTLSACGTQSAENAPSVLGADVEYTGTDPTSSGEQGDLETTELSESELLDLFSEHYEKCKAITVNSEAEQLEFELSSLSDRAEMLYPDRLLPADYEERYIDWRPIDSETGSGSGEVDSGETGSGEVEQEQEQEQVVNFTEVSETVYATGTVNIRAGYSTSSDKLGSLSRGQSVTRIGIGTGEADGWSKVRLSDGSEAFISSNYLSTTKPSTPTPAGSGGSNNTGSSGTTSQPSGGSSGNIDLSTGESYLDQLKKLYPDLTEDEIKAVFGEDPSHDEPNNPDAQLPLFN